MEALALSDSPGCVVREGIWKESPRLLCLAGIGSLRPITAALLLLLV